MPKVWTHRKACRLCNSRKVVPALKYTFSPPDTCFVQPDGSAEISEKIPLILSTCTLCGLLQMQDVVDPERMFRHNIHSSFTTPLNQQHFEAYADDALARGHVHKGDLVIDIGSGDGSLLRALKKRGVRVVGVDPAQLCAEQAKVDGIPHEADFFSPSLAGRILKEHGPANLITANRTLGSIDNLHAVMAGVRHLLKPEGLFYLEEPSIAAFLSSVRFDLVTHEQLTFFTAAPLETFFRSTHMHLIDIKKNDYRGGCIRAIVQRSDGPHVAAASVKALIDEEKNAVKTDMDAMNAFALRVEKLKTAVKTMVESLAAEGKKVVGYGAGGTAVTLIHECAWTVDHIPFIVDENPHKHGLCLPGTSIPVGPPGDIKTKKADVVILLAPHHAEAIIRQHEDFRHADGRFLQIFPTPQLL